MFILFFKKKNKFQNNKIINNTFIFLLSLADFLESTKIGGDILDPSNNGNFFISSSMYKDNNK